MMTSVQSGFESPVAVHAMVPVIAYSIQHFREHSGDAPGAQPGDGRFGVLVYRPLAADAESQQVEAPETTSHAP
jgi:hypothetical protein